MDKSYHSLQKEFIYLALSNVSKDSDKIEILVNKIIELQDNLKELQYRYDELLIRIRNVY